MAFFTFSQNNSGGSFDLDKGKGVTHWVIIESDTAAEANDKMLDLVGDFEGGQGGYCPCCGERWHEVGDNDKSDEPMIYSSPALKEGAAGVWMDKGFNVAIHYKDGRIAWG